MKRYTVFVATALLALSALPVVAQDPTKDAEVAAVKAAVNHYLMGHATGEGAHHAMVFHSVANLYWIDNGELKTRTGAEYIAGSSGKPAPDEAQRKRWIEAVDVTGTAAVAKVVLDYPTIKFTDYFTLLKVGNEWRIVNKIFHREMKPRKDG